MIKQIRSIVLASAIGLTGLNAESAMKDMLGELSASTSVAFESNYVFRGGQQYSDNAAIQPGVDLSMPLAGGDLYVGYWGSYGSSLASESNQAFSETDVYIGYSHALTDVFSVDGGFTYYGFQSSAAGTQDRWKEIYLGVTADGLMPDGIPELSPSLYAYYNFSGEAWTVEGSIGHSWSLEGTSDLPLSLETGAYYGLVSFDDANGDQIAGKASDGYSYYGLNTDLVYTFNDVASWSIGVRWAGNNNNTTAAQGQNLYTFDANGTDSIFWWGTSMSMGF